MDRFTPGPWKVSARDCVSAEYGRIADCRSGYASATEDRANARLIAAAPEMLTALREVERHHAQLNARAGRDEGRSHTLATVRKAIAKATGDA